MVKYFAEYDDLDNNRIRLEIDFKAFSGQPTELILARPAITINYQSDDVFQPLKKSGASISLLLPNVKTDLFTR